MRVILAAATAAAALGMAAPVLAQTDAPSADGVYGNLGWSGTSIGDTMTQSITGRAGARFHQYVSVEGELTGGVDGDHYTYAPGATNQTDVRVKQKLAGAAYVVGFLPVTPHLDILARIGYGGSKYSVNPNGGTKYDVNENGIRYGVGAQYFVGGGNGLRVDYTREHLNDFTDASGFFPAGNEASVWSVSLVHKF